MLHPRRSSGQLIGEQHPARLLLNIGGGGYYTTQTHAVCTIAMATASVTVTDGMYYGGFHIEGSFSAAPAAAAALKLASYAGTTVWSVDITAAGPFSYNLDDALLTVGTGYVATLGDGGASVVGKLNVRPKIYSVTP